jgi:UDP-N-acetylmuramate dehydrogenase
MKKDEICQIFLQKVGKILTVNEPLAHHCHFQIGGPADFFFRATTEEELIASVNFACQQRLRYRVIGGGYNIFFDDRGYRGLIIKNEMSSIQLLDDTQVEVLSGTSLEELIQFCLDHALAGIEFLAGIPGTVGGAIYGNAGAFGQEIGAWVQGVRLLRTSGEIEDVDREHLRFHYRWSSLKKSKDIILRVKLKLKPGERNTISQKIDDILRQRRSKLPPPSLPCGGSFFKNPVLPNGRKVPVAFLLEEVGAKGLRVGGAVVSQAHANFIYNLGGARARDILALASRLKERVRRRFGIELEEEVIFLPEDA